jgi:hypothetical protein
MAYHAYQADLFRWAGVEVNEMAGWKTRGPSRFLGTGDVWHSTVTPSGMSDEAVAALLRDGHATLGGPLSQRGTARDGVAWLVAAGRCNHNGYGYGGNDMFGNEFFNNGYEELFTAAQMRSGLLQSAALATYNTWAVTRVLGHKETDEDRKIDPRNVWMPGVRVDVQHLLDTGFETGEFVMDAEATEAFRKLNERIDRLDKLMGDVHFDVRGADLPELGDENPRHKSIMTGVTYLRGELISGDKKDPNSRWSILQRMFKAYEVPTDPPV